MTKWVEGIGAEDDVVVSTRVRIARNLKDYRFLQMINMEEVEKITQEILDAMKSLPEEVNYQFFKVNALSPVERVSYIEQHLISPGMIQKPDYSSFLLRDDEKVTIMINEEDHLRIQALYPGLNFEEAWESINKIDDFLEGFLDYAYDNNFGYLTSCPTNVGTGLRASAMVHIPCLSITGNVNDLIRGFNKIGLTVRGLYGEGTEAIGDLYQISNQITLGEEEEDIMKRLKNVIYQIINKERNARASLLINNKYEIEDRIFRSYGILQYAQKMSSKEAMKHLSNVRLGKEMGILDNMELKDIEVMMMDVQSGSVQKYAKRELNNNERDIMRAKYLREKI